MCVGWTRPGAVVAAALWRVKRHAELSSIHIYTSETEGLHMSTQESVASASLVNGAEPEEFDLVILGDGTGSTLAAWTFAGEGKRVAVIERKYIGGSCPNIACLPSKNIIQSARVASYFRRGGEFGSIADGFHVDMAAVRS